MQPRRPYRPASARHCHDCASVFSFVILITLLFLTLAARCAASAAAETEDSADDYFALSIDMRQVDPSIPPNPGPPESGPPTTTPTPTPSPVRVPDDFVMSTSKTPRQNADVVASIMETTIERFLLLALPSLSPSPSPSPPPFAPRQRSLLILHPFPLPVRVDERRAPDVRVRAKIRQDKRSKKTRTAAVVRTGKTKHTVLGVVVGRPARYCLPNRNCVVRIIVTTDSSNPVRKQVIRRALLALRKKPGFRDVFDRSSGRSFRTRRVSKFKYVVIIKFLDEYLDKVF